MISKPWSMSSHALLYLNQDEANTSAMGCIKLAQRLSIVVDVADALELKVIGCSSLRGGGSELGTLKT